MVTNHTENIVNCLFSSLRVKGLGGAIYVGSSYVSLKNCSFFNNSLSSSEGRGKDIHYLLANASTLLTNETVDNCCSRSVSDSQFLFTVNVSVNLDSLFTQCTQFTCDTIVPTDSTYYPCGSFCVLGFVIIIVVVGIMFCFSLFYFILFFFIFLFYFIFVLFLDVLGSCLTECSSHSTSEQSNMVCLAKGCTSRVPADDKGNGLCRLNEADGCYEYSGACFYFSCPVGFD
jgi:hypothetical protein